VIIAGLIWGLYNASLGMIFGFGPAMLVERGLSDSSASSITGVALWLVALSVPLGGVIADRTNKRNLVLVVGLLLFATMLIIASRAEAVFVTFVVLGLVGGLSAGPIMSLPSEVLRIETRAVGMGIFFTMFYISVVLAPLIGGYLADVIGTTRVAFDMGAGMLIVCCVALLLFQRLAKTSSGQLSARSANVKA
jgi:MFS family permease